MTLDEIQSYIATFVEVPAAQVPDEQIRSFIRLAHGLIVSLHDWPWLRAPEQTLTVPGGATADGFVAVDQASRVKQVTLRSALSRQELSYIGHETAVRYYGHRLADRPTQWSVVGASANRYAVHVWPKPRADVLVIVSLVAAPALWPSPDTPSTEMPGGSTYPLPHSLHLPLADFALGTALIQKGDPQTGIVMRQSATDVVESVWRSMTPTNLAPFIAGTDTILPGPRPLTDPSDVIATPTQ